MSILGNLTTDGLEEAQDRLGGFAPLDTDIYTGTIKAAYAGESQGGAKNVTLLLDLGGREYRETIYITNKKGENWFTNKQDPSKKVPLPGFTTIDDLCMVTTGKALSEQAVEDKVLNIWDPEQKKELPKSVPVLTELTGQECMVGIVKQTVNKNEKVNGEYVPTSDTRDENVIEKVFHGPTKMTVPEAKQGAETAVFHDTWIAKNKGVTRDRTVRDINSGKSGSPGRGSNTPPKSGDTPARKSLFDS